MTNKPTPAKGGIAVGYWRTRDGSRAYVAAICRPFNWPTDMAIGFWEDSTKATIAWHLDGRYRSFRDGSLDLIEPWRDKVSGTAYAVLFGDELHSFLKEKPVAITGECRMVKVRYEEIADGP